MACLLRHPYCRQVCCTTGQVHASRAHFKKDDIDGPEPCRFRGEEITRQELLVVMPQACAPSGTALRPLWCRRNPSSPEDSADGGTPNGEAQLRPMGTRLAVQLAGAPAWVLLRQPENQRFKLWSDRGATTGAATRERPCATD